MRVGLPQVLAVGLVVTALALTLSACEGSFDQQARQDLENAAMCEELAAAYYNKYATCTDEECEAKLPGFKRSSPYVQISMTANPNGRGFTGTAKHRNGWYSWAYDSRKPTEERLTRQ